MEFSEQNTSCEIRKISTPLYDGQKMIKFVSIATIGSGVITAFSIIGILYAWLPIWMGVLLYKSADAIELAHTTKDEQALMTALKNMKTYFVINGILLILGIVFTLLVLLVYSAFIFALFNWR